MKRYCFGVDVGGTSVKIGLFDTEGEILDQWEIPTRTENEGEHILPDIAASLQEKMQGDNIDSSEVIGVGIGVPGPVDSMGTVYKAVNLGWNVFNIKNVMQGLLNIPVEAGNDANVAALGEMWKGGGRGHNSLVAVTLGTGVGGGVIVDGKILSGSTGAGGEIGHMHVEDKEETACNCGNKGCLEQYASATGVVRLAKRKLAQSEEPSILREGNITAKAVFDAVKAGDAVACEVAEEFGSYLGKALANVSAVVNPEIFVIGGGVSKAGTVILDYIQKYYGPNAFQGSTNTLFALATLGNNAGIYGAAKLVLN